MVAPFIVLSENLLRNNSAEEELHELHFCKQIIEGGSDLIDMVVFCHVIYQQIIVLRQLYVFTLEEVHSCQRALKPLFINRLLLAMPEMDKIQKQKFVARIDLFLYLRLFRHKTMTVYRHHQLLKSLRDIARANCMSMFYRQQYRLRWYMHNRIQSSILHPYIFGWPQTSKRL